MREIRSNLQVAAYSIPRPTTGTAVSTRGGSIAVVAEAGFAKSVCQGAQTKTTAQESAVQNQISEEAAVRAAIITLVKSFRRHTTTNLWNGGIHAWKAIVNTAP